ncbi:MAG: L-serine ammonia-lyase, iron-sulfur-dependent, subunit alpha [Bacteroidales bacterium]|nr:L-serine ammonia-lyase, iron-sulfur-dependent, subunit alpha [Bacteroidales bacterium]MDD2425444.1 L-serine ammonia-lyase, iron-sulfur-dependent, subunit alpha [Bacteroidales bacterium]MDD3988570.1 L-serine ammonia-lyase, iron-sulfur-dependent, subunit alpha [Bacteroidales bacterium]MDD4638505.1 L-serine ammonia-lyase, iron-sulfur-dependent, subunit alpha [Bacteroidales bacterium]
MTLSKTREAEIIELIKNEVKPALGCTEPIAVSLATAKAAEALRRIGYEPEKVKVEVSGNILKNGMGVGVPGTGMVGLHIAAALGVTCGKSAYHLEVLKDLDENSVSRAKEMLNEKLVAINLSKSDKKLYISATCTSGIHKATAVIEDNHDSIVSVKIDNKDIPLTDSKLEKERRAGDKDNDTPGKTTLDYKLDVKTILQFSRQIPFTDIEFILDSVTLNKALALEGLRNSYGLKVGRTIQDNVHKNVFGSGLLTYSMAMTAAASDARMAGCTLPAMSNSGSGNQGITVTMPVIAAAEKLESTREELARALVLSHLIAIHIKGYLGKLSALCGCVIASTGAAAGIVFLRKGNYDQICYSIKNMIGNITGMVCDGAKVGCALKVASGVSSAVQSSILALDNICISENDGIIEKDIEKTIQNLGNIGSKGMENTDSMILDIMVCK